MGNQVSTLTQYYIETYSKHANTSEQNIESNTIKSKELTSSNTVDKSLLIKQTSVEENKDSIPNVTTKLETIYELSDDTAYRILTYNVEWGFLNLPGDIHKDSCGHPIPQTSEAQETHLTLIAKNIGLFKPDFCFLQEMGSKAAVQYIVDGLSKMFNLSYLCYYSNGEDTGNQGVGCLIATTLATHCSVELIPNFKLNRGLGVTFNTEKNTYKLVGVHLKSLYDNKIKKDEAEQESQINAVLDWVKGEENVIVCGDFNNVPNSAPLQLMTNNNYKDIIDSKEYIPNIIADTNTEFHGSSGKETGSRIDYIFMSPQIQCTSAHIIDIEREAIKQEPSLRGETSDHLPILGVFQLV